MKKLITILAIMVILVGAVFADDNAAVQVTVTVPEYVPTFKLATSDTTDISAAVSDLVAASGASSPTSATATATAGQTLAAGNALTITFGVIQVNNAAGYIKTTHGYTFTASATPLILSGKTEDNAAANEKFTVSTIGDITSAANAPGTDYATITSNPYKITYTGAKYTPGAASCETEVATFDVTWGANAAAKNGDYTATVTLTMVTT